MGPKDSLVLVQEQAPWRWRASECACHVGEVVYPEWIAFLDKQRDASILTEVACLLLKRAQPTQLSQRFWVLEDIGIKTGATAYVEREIVVEGDPASTHHLYEDGLRQGDQNDIGEVEVDVLRLGSGPGRKCANNIIARQHHQVIALREDDHAWQRSDPAYHVKHSICAANERWSAGLKLRYHRPRKRLTRCLANAARAGVNPRGAGGANVTVSAHNGDVPSARCGLQLLFVFLGRGQRQGLSGKHRSQWRGRPGCRTRSRAWFADSPLGGTGFEPSVPLLRKALLGLPIGDGGIKGGATYRFRSETAMLAWSGCP